MAEIDFVCKLCGEINSVAVVVSDLPEEEKAAIVAEAAAVVEEQKQEEGVGVETVEEFVCDDCGATNYICWAPGETTRTIPCLSCFHDVWAEDGTKTEEGCKVVAEKGKGVRTFNRDEETLEEVK